MNKIMITLTENQIFNLIREGEISIEFDNNGFGRCDIVISTEPIEDWDNEEDFNAYVEWFETEYQKEDYIDLDDLDKRIKATSVKLDKLKKEVLCDAHPLERFANDMTDE